MVKRYLIPIIIIALYIFGCSGNEVKNMSISAPAVDFIYQTENEKELVVSGTLPNGATHLKVYFSLVQGQLGNISYTALPDTPFSTALANNKYYATVRAINQSTGEESTNTNQLIVLPYKKLSHGLEGLTFGQDEGASLLYAEGDLAGFMYGPNNTVYARVCGAHVLVRSHDWGETWEKVCDMPGNSGQCYAYGGFAVDSKGYLYFANYPDILISRDDGQTFEDTGVDLQDPSSFWATNWNITELMPGEHPDFPDGGIFLSVYASTVRGVLSGDIVGTHIYYSTDANREIWTDYDASALCARHIHGFKINPYEPTDWWLSNGDMWYDEQNNIHADPSAWTLLRTQDKMATWQSVSHVQGPTGQAFYPNGDLLITDDLQASQGGRIWRVTRDTLQKTELFNPASIDAGFNDVLMYDARFIENTETVFVTMHNDNVATCDTGILTNINGSFVPLLWLPGDYHNRTGKQNTVRFSHDSRSMIPSDVPYVFADGLGGIRIPIKNATLETLGTVNGQTIKKPVFGVSDVQYPYIRKRTESEVLAFNLQPVDQTKHKHRWKRADGTVFGIED